MTRRNENLVMSIRDRLLRISRESKEDFQFILTRYAMERFLFRLSKSRWIDRFVLKGALLFLVWSDYQHRPTKDLDLSGFGDGSVGRLREMLVEICEINVVPDGMIYESAGLSISEIRQDQEYQGQRIKLMARLGNARIPLQIDIGFGDAITPEPLNLAFPTFLDMPAPHIRVYPRETVVAEKLQAMVDLGMQNSRMKDFFDVHTMTHLFEFKGKMLVDAITATFKRRLTDIPIKAPLALTDEFANDQSKNIQWKAFLRKSKLPGRDDLRTVVGYLNGFLVPPLSAAGLEKKFNQIWKNGGPWREIKSLK